MEVEVIQKDIYYNFIIFKNNMVVGSMTAEERALDRAGETSASATYNPETNRVTKNT